MKYGNGETTSRRSRRGPVSLSLDKLKSHDVAGKKGETRRERLEGNPYEA